MKKGIIITLPAVINHHFTLDKKNYVKATQLFGGRTCLDIIYLAG